ncbi:hypothetical protein LPJ66_006581 [Kickxella alabastrina]|uniref:Uncharacterized protein n=1 Tax=Kickxella alabastrina TaxID=61397 RepID=A0ACC1IB84_9FUNG|nr:hypothetical protein LPJ66_006581 [Kickxella alabastrina]
MDNLSKASLKNIKLLQLASGRNTSHYLSVTAVTTTAVTVSANSTSASAASDDQLKQMHREIKAHRIQLETAGANNSNIHAQKEKLKPDIAAATTTEDFGNIQLWAEISIISSKVNATILMEKLNDADLESRRKKLEGKLRPVQAKVAAPKDSADTLCKQLEDARTEFWAFSDINAKLAEVEADNTRRQTRISQLERRISRVAKANKSLEDGLADFSSKINGILAEHNERDRSSTAIVVSLERALFKANQQLHSNDLCKRGLRNHNIITQRSDERT